MNEALKLFGLKENATPVEIKQAYRRLALEHHPDKNNNAPKAAEMMKALNAALETVLNDARMCSTYISQVQQEIREKYRQIFVEDNNKYGVIPMKLDEEIVHVNLTIDQVLKGAKKRFNLEKIVKIPNRGEEKLVSVVVVTIPPLCDISKPLEKTLKAGSNELFNATKFVPRLPSDGKFKLEDGITHCDIEYDLCDPQSHPPLNIPLLEGTAARMDWQPVLLVTKKIKLVERGLPTQTVDGSMRRSDVIYHIVDPKK